MDTTGRIFLAADNYLYRLNAQLVQQERVDLGGTVIHEGLAISSTGIVVVCLEDLSCSVYNASNLSVDLVLNWTMMAWMHSMLELLEGIC